MTANKLERAVLAGGCFWGMQALIRKLPGVVNTRVGYTGGEVPNATYRNHGFHAEAIEIEFDPTRISYRDLLELFFQIHDPTTLNRQGNDVGASYRSEIFYVSEAQREEALRTIDDVNASGLWPGRVVTKVSPAGEFWDAEPEHQDYLEHYPNGYTCHFPRLAGSCPGVPPRLSADRRLPMTDARSTVDVSILDASGVTVPWRPLGFYEHFRCSTARNAVCTSQFGVFDRRQRTKPTSLAWRKP